MKSLTERTKSRNILACAELIDQFLAWIEEHRSDRTYDRRKRDLNRFGNVRISEAMTADNDVVTVAKMAGTSIAMIERTYGHFRNEHLHEAQARLDALRQQRRSHSK